MFNNNRHLNIFEHYTQRDSLPTLRGYDKLAEFISIVIAELLKKIE